MLIISTSSSIIFHKTFLSKFWPLFTISIALSTIIFSSSFVNIVRVLPFPWKDLPVFIEVRRVLGIMLNFNAAALILILSSLL